MECGAGNTAESCGSCKPCGNGGDCQPDPGNQVAGGGPGGQKRKKRQAQAPPCIETGNCSKPNYFNQQKYYSLIFRILSSDLICFVTDTSTIYRNCYLWLRYDENTTNFQGYNPSLVQQKIVKYSCNDTAREGTCAFEGKGQGGGPPGMKRRRRQAGPGGGGSITLDKPNICQGTDT